MEGCVFSSSSPLFPSFIPHPNTILHLPVIHLVNMSLFNSNIYHSSCKLHMLQSSLALPTWPFPPSFMHPSVHLFASDKCLSNSTKLKHWHSLLVLFVFNIKGRLQSLIPHSPICSPRVELLPDANTSLRHFNISEGNLSWWLPDRFGFQNKQVALGLHYSKESAKVFDCLLWRVFRRPGFKLHHSGLTSSVMCADEFGPKGQQTFFLLHISSSALPYASALSFLFHSLSIPASLFMRALRSAAYIYAHD